VAETLVVHDIDFEGGVDELGGAIYNTSSILSMYNVDISGSMADYGGGIYVANGGGVILNNMIINGNSAEFDGGGIFAEGISIVEGDNLLWIQDNAAGMRGGGLFLDNYVTGQFDGNLSVSNNTAGMGAGIFSLGALGINQGTISQNHASEEAGAIHLDNVAADAGFAVLRNVTVSGNTADIRGGGIVQKPGVGTETAIFTSTITNNSAPSGGGIVFDGGDLEITGTIIADQAQGQDCLPAPGEMIVSAGYNIDSDGTCQFAQATDIQWGYARLAPLEVNAPSVLATHKPLAGSDAINRIPPDALECLQAGVDARFVIRPQGPACEIGAFELEQDPHSRTWGDNTCDGQFTAADMIAAVAFAAGGRWQRADDCPGIGAAISIVPLFAYGLWADLNCDGVIDGLDGLWPLLASIGADVPQAPDCPKAGDQANLTG
jgi:predicted outer membrane repeat protein